MNDLIVARNPVMRVIAVILIALLVFIGQSTRCEPHATDQTPVVPGRVTINARLQQFTQQAMANPDYS